VIGDFFVLIMVLHHFNVLKSSLSGLETGSVLHLYEEFVPHL